MNTSRIDSLIGGLSTELPDSVRDQLEKTTQDLSRQLDRARHNRETSDILGGSKTPARPVRSTGDTEMFTTISEMINGSTKDFAGFGTLMENLYEKNKKYFSIIKDYELMPILIPQINRVLSFLVNECLSPDIQNNQTFTIKYTGPTSTTSNIQKEIDRIKHEMKLDNLLREVYTNRYKLGQEFYAVEDYNATFKHMEEQLKKKRMNEATIGMSDMDYLDRVYSGLIGRIDEVTCQVPFTAVQESRQDPNNAHSDRITDIVETSIPWTLKNLNIVIERSPIVEMVKDAQAEIIKESYSRWSYEYILRNNPGEYTSMNEDGKLDPIKTEQLIKDLQKKKLQRCTIKRFDPARIYRLKLGGRVIGFFYVSDVTESAANMVNFAQALKDQLIKSRATNLSVAQQSAEDVISKELAERIIKTFDPNLGITRIEDIDLLHDFIRNNEIYKGNKKITFYYQDEIYDMSRADGSILTNAVFFTKLYSTLMLNNIITKVLRGRGRQIHTVTTGASPNTQRYIDNAMAALAMPENNLGTLHGSFEQIMNPFNGASDIVIPTEDNTEQFIRTDYIPGQDVDMNDDFLRTLLNSIITSFNLDAAVLDATNGNLQFARTLTMESLQISTSIRCEQQDTHDPWEAMCLKVLEIMGSAELQEAIKNGQVEVNFFEPKSLIIQNIIDDMNNYKNLAETVADIVPMFNDEGMEKVRDRWIFEYIAKKSNYDFSEVFALLNDIQIRALDDEMQTKITELIKSYQDNTREVEYGSEDMEKLDDSDLDDDGLGDSSDMGDSGDTDTDDITEDEEDTGGETDDEESELTDEEEDLMNMPDEEEDEDF